MNPPNSPVETRVLLFSNDSIAAAADLILVGQPVAIPTETVYGLAADASNADAVVRIYRAKGRPSFNPLIVHVADVAAAQRIAHFDDVALALAAAFWPGPLTLVLPLRRKKSGITSMVTAGLDTVAIRVPAHRAMRALLDATGKPLAAPSANASGAISPTRAAHVVTSLGGRIPLVIDDGATAAGLESTIVFGQDVLRPGPITADMLLPYLFPGDDKAQEPVDSDTRALASPDKRKVTAPGQLASHYATSKPLRLGATKWEADEYLIGFGPVTGDDNLSMSADLTEAAANLFEALHRADASRAARIAVAPIPFEGIGIAINDRLARAAHGG